MLAGAFSFGLPLFFSMRALVTTTLSRFTRFFEAGGVGSSPCFDPAQPILVFFSLLYSHYAVVLEILRVLLVGSTSDPPKVTTTKT